MRSNNGWSTQHEIRLGRDSQRRTTRGPGFVNRHAERRLVSSGPSIKESAGQRELLDRVMAHLQVAHQLTRRTVLTAMVVPGRSPTRSTTIVRAVWLHGAVVMAAGAHDFGASCVFATIAVRMQRVPQRHQQCVEHCQSKSDRFGKSRTHREPWENAETAIHTNETDAIIAYLQFDCNTFAEAMLASTYAIATMSLEQHLGDLAQLSPARATAGV